MSFTDEELLAVARVVWPELGVYCANCDAAWLNIARGALSGGGEMVNAAGTVDEFAVRLALAHPEKAGEALGPGWEVMTGSAANGRAVFVWCAPLDIGELELWVREGGVALIIDPDADCVFELPPEFLAALQRAYLSAAAWKRIEAAKEA